MLRPLLPQPELDAGALTRRRLAGALSLATAAVLAATIAAARDRAPAVPTLREVPADGRLTLILAGRPVSVFAGPGMPSRLYLSRMLAASLIGPGAAGFEESSGFSIAGFSIGGTGARIGPVRIRGKSDSLPLGDGPRPDAIGVSWFERDAYPIAPVLAGPYALPEQIVRFTLHPERPGEVTATLPLGNRRVWWLATTLRQIGGAEIAFALAPNFPHTVASAAAGAAIARAHGGSFAGISAPVAISHGVTRPARPMALARPLAFGPVSIDRLLVRTADYGSTAGIADPSEVVDSPADAIVVKGRRQRSKPSYVVYLGADLLGGCSSITYDKPAATITLRCQPSAP